MKYHILNFRDFRLHTPQRRADWGGGGGKYIFSESSLQDQFRNKRFKTVPLKTFGTKDYYFTTHVTKQVLS